MENQLYRSLLLRLSHWFIPLSMFWCYCKNIICDITAMPGVWMSCYVWAVIKKNILVMN